jgi:hypothetical protein
MSREQLRQGLVEGPQVELTAEPPEGGQVIGGEAWLQLLKKPEARLGVGGREHLSAGGPVACQRLGLGDHLAATPVDHFLDAPGEGEATLGIHETLITGEEPAFSGGIIDPAAELGAS